MLQMNSIKKLTFLVVTFVLFLQMAHSQSLNQSLRRGDLAFKNQEYTKAQAIYEQALLESAQVPATVYLKLANIYEQQNELAKVLYYLNKAYERAPDERILKKMSVLAADNGLKGYELNDLNFFVMLYKQYSHFLFMLLVLLGLYIFGVLLYKRLKNQYIPIRQKVFFLFYIIGVVALINLPNSYQSAIVYEDKVFLRTEPSAAAPVADVILKGHRFNVLGSNDNWYRVLWENDFVFIRKQAVMLID